MIEIKPLSVLDHADLTRLITGYTSRAKYEVQKAVTADTFTLRLSLTPLETPYHKQFDLDAATVAHYQQLVGHGFSFCAVERAGADPRPRCVGLALAEPQQWNKSLAVWELHVAADRHGRGIGRQLVDALSARARAAGLRNLVCETQNTNVPAIHFYRRVGFQLDGIDLSFYSNDDFPHGEIAIFMKKYL